MIRIGVQQALLSWILSVSLYPNLRSALLPI